MAELLYDDIAAELAEFANYDVDDSALDLRKLINRAVRYVGNWQSGRWNSLYIRDYATTLDSTGYLVTFPADMNVLKCAHQATLERYQYRRWLDYDYSVAQPSNLVTEPARKIKFYYALSPNMAIYLTYWRKIKEFANAADQSPDIPQSGDAILETAKWFAIRNERDSSGNEKKEQQELAEAEIRRLWAKDNGFDIDSSAPAADLNLDSHYGMTNYDLSDGGDSIKLRGPIMDRNYGG